jgi:hypothetical protein
MGCAPPSRTREQPPSASSRSRPGGLTPSGWVEDEDGAGLARSLAACCGPVSSKLEALCPQRPPGHGDWAMGEQDARDGVAGTPWEVANIAERGITRRSRLLERHRHLWRYTRFLVRPANSAEPLPRAAVEPSSPTGGERRALVASATPLVTRLLATPRRRAWAPVSAFANLTEYRFELVAAGASADLAGIGPAGYLRSVSPKTFSRWAKEDKLPFMKNAGWARPLPRGRDSEAGRGPPAGTNRLS